MTDGTALLPYSDSRVCYGVHDVCKEVAQEGEKSADDENTHNGRIVSGHNAHVEKLPHAGNGKDAFHDDAPSDESRNGKSEDGDDGKQGVPESMLPEDHAFGKALRIGGRNVFLSQHFKKAVLHIPRYPGKPADGRHKHDDHEMFRYIDDLSEKRQIGKVE